ncbi:MULTISPECIES: XRE family transcriptional regulator [Paenibacillus]|uniref:XRE family transcriptional regulator n=2 Tax=Paenibacillus TaxID=44249 RepID=UPI0003E29485|nr:MULTISPECIES: XRE family transcriptional regulator [Paenibacillus]ETT66189.1 helix-turn-helix domain-containing protein [Paenibacillus sp. FSL H8-457]MCM3258503.1 XRE family transcriptional regulator [Paenibacillus lautus]
MENFIVTGPFMKYIQAGNGQRLRLSKSYVGGHNFLKFELGRCLLNERLVESGKSAEWLAKDLLIKPERVYDFMENKRVMPLKIAISIADSIGCDVRALYELIPQHNEAKGDSRNNG